MTRILAEANPWWRAAASGSDPQAWVSSNRLLSDRARYDLGYRPDVLDDIAAEPVGDALVVLTGPRRIGKSVVLLDTAAKLCARADIDPRQVVYVPCDGFTSRNLRRVFALARNQTRSVDRGGVRPRVWLLDEIGMIRGWAQVLKGERDIGPLGEDTVIATGSRWNPAEDIPGHLLAGRAGKSPGRRLRHLMPMTFRNFVIATRRGLPLPDPTHPAELQSKSVGNALENVRFDLDGFDLAWQAYLTSGGFPRAVAEYDQSGSVSESYMRDLEAWLRSDVDPSGPPESIPLLLSELTRRATSPLNRTNIADTLDYERRTFDRRKNRLVHSFAGLDCPQRKGQGQVVENSQAKFYLIDPVLAWLPRALRSGLPRPDMTVLNEMSVGVALANAIEQLEEGRWTSGDTIGYARTGSGNEIDFGPVPMRTTSGAGLTVPIESKWIDGRWRAKAMAAENTYGKGIIATKSVLDMDHKTWAVPAPLVALLLG